jgi:predicted GNAT superfamily acetyltransferase
MMKIRSIQPADFSAVVELNLRSVHYLSSLSLKRLAQLHAQAAYARVMEADGRIVAFVLAFRENAGYDSPNYLWFSERYNAFLYIDRVVVRENHRRKGIAGIFIRICFLMPRGTEWRLLRARWISCPRIPSPFNFTGTAGLPKSERCGRTTGPNRSRSWKRGCPVKNRKQIRRIYYRWKKEPPAFFIGS